MNIRDDINEVLSNIKEIYSYREIVSDKDIDILLDKEVFKCCAYSITPKTVRSDGAFIYNVSFCVIDIINDNEDIINSTIESSMECLRRIYKNLYYKSGDMVIDYNVSRKEDTDMIGVFITGNVTYIC